MQRLFTVVWVFHVPLLAAWAMLLLLCPEAWVQAPHDVATSGLSLLTSTLQYTAGPTLGLAFAAMYAAMRQEPTARRRIARALAIAFFSSRVQTLMLVKSCALCAASSCVKWTT